LFIVITFLPALGAFWLATATATSLQKLTTAAHMHSSLGYDHEWLQKNVQVKQNKKNKILWYISVHR